MKITTFLLLAATSAVSLLATPILTVTPADVEALPGEITGWTLNITGDTQDWVSITGSVLLFESNPSLGTYLDLTSSQNGPINGAIPAGSSWNESFDFTSGSGLAAFLVDPGAMLGDMDSGTIRVLYDRFSADPSSCISCYVDSGSMDAVVRVTAAGTPEPGSGWLLLAGAGLIWACRRFAGRNRAGFRR